MFGLYFFGIINLIAVCRVRPAWNIGHTALIHDWLNCALFNQPGIRNKKGNFQTTPVLMGVVGVAFFVSG